MYNVLKVQTNMGFVMALKCMDALSINLYYWKKTIVVVVVVVLLLVHHQYFYKIYKLVIDIMQ